MASVNVVVVGLGFGRDFLPLYREHPDVGRVGICDADPERMAAIGDAYGIGDRFGSLEEALADDRYDAVHLLTPVRFHARQAVQVLESGRDCACAVPMATSLDDIAEIMAAERRSGRTYMMMETAVYGREYLHVREQRDRGVLGPLTFLRGMHIQDLDQFPTYWWGFPPMHYITHALSPLLSIADAQASSVRCLGSGRLAPELIRDHANPYPVESALFRLDRDDLAAEVTMSFFQVARGYQEGFAVYGQGLGFEWEQLAGEGPAEFRMRPVAPGSRGRQADERRIEPADHPETLPEPLRPFLGRHHYDPGTGRGVQVGDGHGGSHPHLVHEFVSSIVERRRPAVDTVTAARFTAPGICAHESALAEGTPVDIPRYDISE